MKIQPYKILTLIFGIALLSQPIFADRVSVRAHFDLRSGYPHHGVFVRTIPRNYVTIRYGRVPYYYGDGVFYRHVGISYIVSAPPIGFVVTSLPDYQVVAINGDTYFVYNGVYYRQVPTGYEVVSESPITVEQPAPPAVVVQPAPAPAPTTTYISTPPSNETFTVNIPTNSGNYAPVLIRRSGKGFVGPQGEYYSEFPRVEQLRVMYGH